MQKHIIYTEKAPEPIGPYSQAVLIKDTLYASGQIAYEASLSGNLELETEQVMKNLEEVLKAAGMTFDNVVKCSIFLKSMDSFSVVNEIYGRYFKENPPARETVEVSKLPKDVNVEISLIAVL
ncbi:Rid family detoxifying hydrolase [Arcticibacterium luteifluviistationis]|uniref:Reactive intermediate/imine deaminase n=1 Tax=Arcticibacterium luteifluviistationis TaxID=1784714 RepID=A0A2Z4GFU0_9BACT|nr:Rid family detoxifying hydrolase [Arcticibacterium luteifluviistationis]AWW00177.1 reactive intermediate/imine deaminase [Arcticibacterium luteifluviistationis]